MLAKYILSALFSALSVVRFRLLIFLSWDKRIIIAFFSLGFSSLVQTSLGVRLPSIYMQLASLIASTMSNLGVQVVTCTPTLIMLALELYNFSCWLLPS